MFDKSMDGTTRSLIKYLTQSQNPWRIENDSVSSVYRPSLQCLMFKQGYAQDVTMD